MGIHKKIKEIEKYAVNKLINDEDFRQWCSFCSMPETDVFHYKISYDGIEVLLTSKFNPEINNMPDDKIEYYNQYGDCDIIINGEEYKGRSFIWNWLTEKVSYKKGRKIASNA